jgi:hypothetical protein
MTTTKNKTAQKLIELGGKEWEKEDKHRIYFNFETFENFVDIEIEYYTAMSWNKIRNIYYKGKRLNSHYTRELQTTTIYYDVHAEEFITNDKRFGNDIINSIKNEIYKEHNFKSVSEMASYYYHNDKLSWSQAMKLAWTNFQ